MGAVAGAEPTAVVAGLADGDTAEMRADTCGGLVSGTALAVGVLWVGPGGMCVRCAEVTCCAGLVGRGNRWSRGFRLAGMSPTQHYKPLGLLDAVVVLFGVAEGADVDLVGLGDLAGGPVPDEDGLATPLDDDLREKKKPQYCCSPVL